jgi:hypothetical protein
MRDRRGSYRDLMERPDVKRPIRRSRHRWGDNIKFDLQEMGVRGMDWIALA